ncbi:16S rRNA (cytosine(1402)-N(4))-methyltransferase RsmH [Alloscardovia venturai]|uniref:Ribosomal RNA small subunit methyltransferase H n=1 Tax=Alloscardovia venturai TaxID=1769421 RepID=A0ABW2YAL9_9BIFI
MVNETPMKKRADEIHVPVLFDECVRLVTQNVEASAKKDGREFPVIVDCTLGLAGHTSGFLKAIPSVRVIGIDRDAQALALATQRVADLGLGERFIPAHAAFDDFTHVLHRNGINHVDAVFMDLGLSSLQIDETERGFSYSHDSVLDMRMDVSQELTAADILRAYAYEDLVRIFKEYGEERFSSPIAREIVHMRERGEFIETSHQLTAVVDRVIPKAKRPAGNPAKRVFQALRIEVNGELDKLASTLPQALRALSVGGRLVVESYHSLEDKCVKNFMSRGLHADVPVGLPVIPQEAMPYLKDLTHGAMKADEAEIARNSRSASVRLRAVEVIRPAPPSAFDFPQKNIKVRNIQNRNTHKARTAYKTRHSKGHYGSR